MADQDSQGLAQSFAQFLVLHREIKLFRLSLVDLLQRARGLATPTGF